MPVIVDDLILASVSIGAASLVHSVVAPHVKGWSTEIKKWYGDRYFVIPNDDYNQWINLLTYLSEIRPEKTSFTYYGRINLKVPNEPFKIKMNSQYSMEVIPITNPSQSIVAFVFWTKRWNFWGLKNWTNTYCFSHLFSHIYNIMNNSIGNSQITNQNPNQISVKTTNIKKNQMGEV
jgi:hypothetical protein